jgi:UDP-glucose 4-epimerase
VRYGDGEEIREYVHVFDAARCSVDILDDKYINQHVVITGNQQIKVKDLLIMIKEMMGNKIRIEYRPIDDAASPYDPSVHYEITPYIFNPKLAKKIVSNHYIDLGQGVVELLKEVYKEHVLADKEALKANQ